MIFKFLLLLNVITFCVFGYDKYLAKTNKWRIPERTLFLLSFMGGSVGATLGMLIFRHKIAKPSFYLSILIIIVIQILGVWYFGLKELVNLLNLEYYY